MSLTVGGHGYLLWRWLGAGGGGEELWTALWALVVVLLTVAAFTAVNFVRRFAGRPADHLVVAAALSAVFLLPWLPLLIGSYPPGGGDILVFTLAVSAGCSILAVKACFDQGRYPLTHRDFPDLAGAARVACEAAVERAGLRAIAIKVVPFPYYNAAVQGVRNCLILVDKRASESLSAEELGAVVAHECGHVRLGGMLPYALVFPAVACAANTLFIVSGQAPSITPLLALALLATLALSHALEFACDGMAARWTSAGAIAAGLVRIVGDMVAPVRRLTQSAWIAPVCTHPGLPVRLAALGQAPRRVFVAYLAAWVVAFGLVVPAVATDVLGAFSGVPRGRPPAALPGLYIAWIVVASFVQWRLLHRSMIGFAGSKRARPGRWRWWLWTLLAWAVAVALAAVFWVLRDSVTDRWGEQGWVSVFTVLVLASFFGLLFLLVTGVLLALTRARRRGLESLPRGVRRKVIEASAAVLEGCPAEGLEIIDQIGTKYRDEPWVVTARSSCLINLGRPDEALAELRTLHSADAGFSPGLLNLALAELYRGDTGEAASVARELAEVAQDNPDLHRCCGLIHWRAGDAGAAEGAFARALELRPTDAGALAGRVLLQLDAAAGSPEDLGPEVRRAIEAGRVDSFVLLLEVRWKQAAGHTAEAAAACRRLQAEARAKGNRAWEEFALELARGWGVATPDPDD